jgi:hypothetical protein
MLETAIYPASLPTSARATRHSRLALILGDGRQVTAASRIEARVLAASHVLSTIRLSPASLLKFGDCNRPLDGSVWPTDLCCSDLMNAVVYACVVNGANRGVGQTEYAEEL